MTNEKIELQEKLAWVYLNKALLELPEEKRVKSIETLAANPDQEFPLAVLVHISDVPEELKRKAIRTIFSNNRWPSCGITEFLSQVFDSLRNLPTSLREEIYAGTLSLPNCQDPSFLRFLFFEFKERSVPDYWKIKVLKKTFELNDRRDFLDLVSYRLNLGEFPIGLRIKALEVALESPTHHFLIIREHYFSFGDIPDDLKRKAMERFVQENPSIFLTTINNPPEELKKRAVELNRQSWPTDKLEIMRIIDSILPEWIVGENNSPAFQRINNVPVFRPGPWEILDKTTHEKPEMILLLLKGGRHRSNDDVAVLLLRDISHDNLGYALRVPPDIKKVKEAHAYICRQDPKVFDGFAKEV